MQNLPTANFPPQLGKMSESLKLTQNIKLNHQCSDTTGYIEIFDELISFSDVLCGQLQCEDSKTKPVVDYGGSYTKIRLDDGNKCRSLLFSVFLLFPPPFCFHNSSKLYKTVKYYVFSGLSLTRLQEAFNCLPLNQLAQILSKINCKNRKLACSNFVVTVYERK